MRSVRGSDSTVKMSISCLACSSTNTVKGNEEMKLLKVAALLWLSSGLFAHAQFIKWGTDKTIPLSISHPPQFGLTVKRVAFGQPGGSCPGEATELVDRMILPDFQQNQMDVIERQALNQIMSEHKFNETAYADPSSAAQLGRILGPSALIIVSVNNCSSSQLPLFNDQKNFLNGAVTRTFISKTRYSLEGSLRIVDLTTGQILGSHNFQSNKEQSNDSQQGQPEYPPVDQVKDQAMQDVGFQVHAMFFPSGDGVELTFYDDKDCNLNQVYQMYKNGDRDGALHTMDANLEECKTGKHKDKTLARADYDDALLHCLHKDYDQASALFTSAMDVKGADAVSTAAAACARAKDGASALKAYEAKLAQIQAPPPINNSPLPQAASNQAQPTPPPVPGTVNPPPSSATGGMTVEERLKKLDSLYKRNLITKKEYDEKRAEILKDI